MKDLEKVAGEDFFRIHRAYLINLRFVRSYEKEAVQLLNKELPIARANYQGFVKAFMRYQEKG
ncbi:MAG: LytTR family transcriptional regulator [Lachnospiraceae bacterium]|nr:LytTR family transcriptional regulator [Lachnospiraceae bacterium]